MNNNVTAMPSVDDVRIAVRSACERLPIARVQIFGSLATGCAHRDSDVDLLVDTLPESQMGLLEMGALKEDLEGRLGCSVDLVSRAAVNRSRNPYRRRSILAAPITVYDR